MWNFLLGITAVLCLLTLTGFLGKRHWRFELTSHFRWHFFVGLLLLAGLFVWGKQTAWAIWTGLFSLINLSVILPLYLPQQIDSPDKAPYRALMLNVWYRGDDYCGVKALIQNTNPDVVVLVEVTPAWEAGLREVIAHYPYRDGAAITRTYGVMFLSRVPLCEGGLYRLNDGERPSVIAHLDFPERPLTLIGMHPAAPVRSERAKIRNEQLQTVSQFVQKQTDSVLLMGDLNITPWSPHFSAFLHQSGLRNGRVGFGRKPSWPAKLAWLGIPIDHALISPEITIHEFQTGTRVGSDHLPIIVDFSLNGDPSLSRKP